MGEVRYGSYAFAVLMKFAQNVWIEKKSWGQQIFELGWGEGCLIDLNFGLI